MTLKLSRRQAYITLFVAQVAISAEASCARVCNENLLIAHLPHTAPSIQSNFFEKQPESPARKIPEFDSSIDEQFTVEIVGVRSSNSLPEHLQNESNVEYLQSTISSRTPELVDRVAWFDPYDSKSKTVKNGWKTFLTQYERLTTIVGKQKWLKNWRKSNSDSHVECIILGQNLYGNHAGHLKAVSLCARS